MRTFFIMSTEEYHIPDDGFLQRHRAREKDKKKYATPKVEMTQAELDELNRRRKQLLVSGGMSETFANLTIHWINLCEENYQAIQVQKEIKQKKLEEEQQLKLLLEKKYKQVDSVVISEMSNNEIKDENLYAYGDIKFNSVSKPVDQLALELSKSEKERQFWEKYLPVLQMEARVFKDGPLSLPLCKTSKPISMALEFVKRQYFTNFGVHMHVVYKNINDISLIYNPQISLSTRAHIFRKQPKQLDQPKSKEQDSVHSSTASVSLVKTQEEITSQEDDDIPSSNGAEKADEDICANIERNIASNRSLVESLHAVSVKHNEKGCISKGNAQTANGNKMSEKDYLERPTSNNLHWNVKKTSEDNPPNKRNTLSQNIENEKPKNPISHHKGNYHSMCIPKQHETQQSTAHVKDKYDLAKCAKNKSKSKSAKDAASLYQKNKIKSEYLPQYQYSKLQSKSKCQSKLPVPEPKIENDSSNKDNYNKMEKKRRVQNNTGNLCLGKMKRNHSMISKGRASRIPLHINHTSNAKIPSLTDARKDNCMPTVKQSNRSKDRSAVKHKKSKIPVRIKGYVWEKRDTIGQTGRNSLSADERKLNPLSKIPIAIHRKIYTVKDLQSENQIDDEDDSYKAHLLAFLKDHKKPGRKEYMTKEEHFSLPDIGATKFGTSTFVASNVSSDRLSKDVELQPEMCETFCRNSSFHLPQINKPTSGVKSEEVLQMSEEDLFCSLKTPSDDMELDS